jgi:dTDP-4-dehydrorhamnose reductase
MLKIAITGADGLIGSRIIELLEEKFSFVPLSQEVMDITNRDEVDRVINNIDFDIFLHLAAYTNVDKAENEREKAWQVNVEGTKNVFEAVFLKKKKFIYISTDFVFDGKKENTPFFEDSLPNPISFYGKTKYEGEKIVENMAMIIRLSYPYRAYFKQKKDFARRIIENLKEKKIIKMVKNSLITPTFIDDIAFSLEHLLVNYSPEIFHLVGKNALSPYEAGLLIAKIFHLPKSLIEEVFYDEFYKDKAKRPQYSDIRSKKNDFFPMSNFEKGLMMIKKQL